MADILTRREARQQAKQNRGYNRGQFQTAMGNAKDALRRNSDLRGRELRQTARRMVAGTGEYAQSSLPPTFEEWINSPVLAGRPSSGGAEVARAAVQRGISKANRIDAVTPIVNPDTNFSGLAGRPQQETPTADLTGAGSFDNAFALARKNGMKVFTWNGKKYGTKMDPNWRERWGRVKSQNQPNNEADIKIPDLNSALAAANNDITSQIDNDIAAQKNEGRVKSKNSNGSNSSSVPDSSVSDLGLTRKVNNWNISDILPEDFYNDLQSSLQEGIDEELAAQENAAIQDRIESFKSDLGPTMKAPWYMMYMSAPASGKKPGWYTSKDIFPGQYNWYRRWLNNKYGDYFVSKDGSTTWFNPFPDDLQEKYKGAKFYRPKDSPYGYTLVPDMDHYYGGIPMPIGKTTGYKPANPAISGQTPKQITGGQRSLVPTW